jgi:hypothetical protein
MVVPLWSVLVLAASPAPPPVAPPSAVPSLGEMLSGLMEHWSFGVAASAGLSAGRDGGGPAFSVGLVSDVFAPRPARGLRGLESHLGLALGGRAARGWEWELRGTAAGQPVAWGPFTLGVAASVVVRFDGPWAVSARLGPELAGHFRVGDTLHVLQPFARCEWSLGSRDRFPDVGTVGLQVLWSD